MAKLGNHNMFVDSKKTDSEIIERIEGMIDDSAFEFALEDLEVIYDYVLKTGRIEGWMEDKLNYLDKWKQRQDEFE